MATGCGPTKSWSAWAWMAASASRVAMSHPAARTSRTGWPCRCRAQPQGRVCLLARETLPLDPAARPAPPAPAPSQAPNADFVALWQDLIGSLGVIAAEQDRRWQRRSRVLNTLLVICSRVSEIACREDLAGKGLAPLILCRGEGGVSPSGCLNTTAMAVWEAKSSAGVVPKDAQRARQRCAGLPLLAAVGRMRCLSGASVSLFSAALLARPWTVRAAGILPERLVAAVVVGALHPPVAARCSTSNSRAEAAACGSEVMP